MRISFTALALAALTSSPALAVDACLVGVWQADGSEIARVMASQMGGQAEFVGGSATLEISDTGVMRLVADGLTIQVAMPDVPAMPVTVNGYSQGTISADDGANYVADTPDYSLIGSAEVMGMRMDIPVTSADGGVWGQSRGTYACGGNVLTFTPDVQGSIPQSWQRAS